MNEHALRVIQYPEALALVAGQASSRLGAEAIRDARPAKGIEWVRTELRTVEEMGNLLIRMEEPAMPPIPDPRQPLRRRAVHGSLLEGAALYGVGGLLRSARALRRLSLRHSEQHPLLAAPASHLPTR